jgi:hypothetical protein
LIDGLQGPRPQPGGIGVEAEHELGLPRGHPTGEPVSEPLTRRDFLGAWRSLADGGCAQIAQVRGERQRL